MTADCGITIQVHILNLYPRIVFCNQCDPEVHNINFLIRKVPGPSAPTILGPARVNPKLARRNPGLAERMEKSAVDGSAARQDLNGSSDTGSGVASGSRSASHTKQQAIDDVFVLRPGEKVTPQSNMVEFAFNIQGQEHWSEPCSLNEKSAGYYASLKIQIVNLSEPGREREKCCSCVEPVEKQSHLSENLLQPCEPGN